jgi:hypothetical protein
MILARLSRAVREQNWFAVVLEFFIVIAGVVIGFQITAWNGERQEKERAQEVMARIEAELDEMITQAETNVARAAQTVAALDTVFGALSRQELTDDERQSFEIGLLQLDTFTQADWRLGTVDELVANGELNLIRDIELRSALVSYRDDVDGTNAAFMHIRLAMGDYPQGIHRYVTFGPTSLGADVLDIQNPDFDRSAAGLLAYDFDAMAADPDVINAVGMMRRLQGYFLINHQGLLAYGREIENQLDRSEP